MGMICVNQNEETNLTTTSTPRCVADWAHTQEQVVHAAYLLAGLVLIALLWTAASRRQRKSLRKGELGFAQLPPMGAHVPRRRHHRTNELQC